jgi:hypothetical protein
LRKGELAAAFGATPQILFHCPQEAHWRGAQQNPAASRMNDCERLVENAGLLVAFAASAAIKAERVAAAAQALGVLWE